MSLQADLINGCRSIAESINDAMYIDGKPRYGRSDISKEDMFTLLEDTRKSLYDIVDEGEKELGWRR